jgi:hypothetical protein
MGKLSTCVIMLITIYMQIFKMFYFFIQIIVAIN